MATVMIFAILPLVVMTSEIATAPLAANTAGKAMESAMMLAYSLNASLISEIATALKAACTTGPEMASATKLA